MTEIKRYIFWIRPQTRVEIRDDEKWMLTQTNAYLMAYGQKRHEDDVKAIKNKTTKKKNPKAANYYVLRKQRMEKWLKYKIAVKAVADLEKFLFPEQGGYFKFFVPMSESWSKKKKNQMEFTICQNAPDASNYYKALEDSLLIQDKAIADYRVSKFWYSGRGHIEITVGELPPAIGYTKNVFKVTTIK